MSQHTAVLKRRVLFDHHKKKILMLIEIDRSWDDPTNQIKSLEYSATSVFQIIISYLNIVNTVVNYLPSKESNFLQLFFF